MSVINNVLKDLDNKPSSFTPLRLQSAVEKKNPSHQKPYVGWLFFLILLMGIVAAWLWTDLAVEQQAASVSEISSSSMPLVDSGTSVAEADQVENVKAVAATAPATEIVATPAREIIGLQINETPEFLELAFQLTSRGQSYLKQRAENRYVFTLVDTRSQINAPMIQQNPWLQEMQIENADDQVEILFMTLPGVLLETRQRQQEDGPFWLVRLKKTLVSVVQETQAVKIAASTEVEQPGRAVTDKPLSLPQSTQAVGEQQSVSAVSEPVRLQIKPVETQISNHERLQLALQDMQSGNLIAAQQDLQRLLGSELDRDVRLHLLNLWQQQRNLSDYRQLLNQSLQVYPADEGFALMDASILFSSAQYLPLVERYRDFQSSAKLLALVAAAYQRMQQHEKASIYFKQSLALDSEQPKNWISLAISQEKLSKNTEALDSYQMAQRSGPVNQRLDDFIRQRIDALDKMTQ